MFIYYFCECLWLLFDKRFKVVSEINTEYDQVVGLRSLCLDRTGVKVDLGINCFVVLFVHAWSQETLYYSLLTGTIDIHYVINMKHRWSLSE